MFSDPHNEIGNFADEELTWSADLYLSPRMRLPLWRGGFLGIVADHRIEGVQVDERSSTVGSTSGDATRTRLSFGLGAELEQFLLPRRWLLVPALRVDGYRSRFAVPPGGGELSDQGRNVVDIGFSPRMGTRFPLARGLDLRASGGRYFRAPTLLELFGDRGYIVGNEGLRVERGTSIDGGLVVDRSIGRGLALYGQLAGFATWSRDLIQWTQAGTVTRPANVPGARIRGLETSLWLDVAARTLVLQGNYTLLDSRNGSPELEQRDKPLPGRPRHEVFAQASVGHEWQRSGVEIEPRVFYTVEFIAGTFLDPSGRRQVPARTLQGVGAELHLAQRAHLAVELRNLLDVRVTTWTPPIAGVGRLRVPVGDFIGFPLPGRSVWITLRIDLEPKSRLNTAGRPGRLENES
jgi:iron complex outermembrane receptor protein